MPTAAPVPPPSAPPRRVLVTRLAGIGDFTLLVPFLRQLRRALPDARIDACVPPSVRPLADACPYLDRAFSPPPWPGGWPQRLKARFVHWRRRRALRALADGAGGPAYDWIFNIDPFRTMIYPSAYLYRYADAPRIVGFDRGREAPGRENRRETERAPRPDGRPMAEYGWSLLRQAGLPFVEDGRLELWAPDAERARAAALLPADGGPYVACCASSSTAPKNWNVARYAELLAGLRRDTGLRPVPLGVAAERAALADALAAHPGVDAVSVDPGESPPATFDYALLERSALYVGNDTGPMHMAAAAGIPVVAAFLRGLASPCLVGLATYRPWGVPHRIVTPPDPLCPACAHPDPAAPAHCIDAITVAAMRAAVDDLRAEIARAAPPPPA